MSGNSGNLLEKLLCENNDVGTNKFLKKELLFKILIIGDFGVGTFSSSYKITIGADFAIKTVEWDDNTRVNLQLWDIAGHERFGALTGVYYRYAVAAAIVFDLTRPETFKSVEKWLFDLRKKAHLPCGQAIPVVVLANKGDVTIATLPSEIVHFCDKFNILAWFITSAKDNVHIDEAMLTLINAALQNRENLQFPIVEYKLDTIVLSSNTEKNDNKKYCCQT